jgi:hypothetical protein
MAPRWVSCGGVAASFPGLRLHCMADSADEIVWNTVGGTGPAAYI